MYHRGKQDETRGVAEVFRRASDSRPSTLRVTAYEVIAELQNFVSVFRRRIGKVGERICRDVNGDARAGYFFEKLNVGAQGDIRFVFGSIRYVYVVRIARDIGIVDRGSVVALRTRYESRAKKNDNGDSRYKNQKFFIHNKIIRESSEHFKSQNQSALGFPSRVREPFTTQSILSAGKGSYMR